MKAGYARFEKVWDPKNFFFGKTPKGGRGVSPNPKFPYQKKMRFVWIFSKGGGGSFLLQKGVIIKNGDFWIFLL